MLELGCGSARVVSGLPAEAQGVVSGLQVQACNPDTTPA